MKKIFSYTGMLLSIWSCGAHQGVVKKDETVILFPTSGYIDSNSQAHLPLHGWIFEYEYDSLWREASVNVLQKSLELNDVSLDNELFKQRAWMFLVDNERGKKIRIAIDGNSVECGKSEPNGHFHCMATLNPGDKSTPQKPVWISYAVELKGGDQRTFTGESQLLPTQGVSIISDIDDTIKDSHVADKKELLKNTFVKEFRAVPGMAGVYEKWQTQGAAFHYLSASPWQLYPSLADFIRDNKFPKGDFSLRLFRIKDKSFYELFASPFEYKTQAIEEIMKYYPQRKFVLVGDSTESDAEVYSHIAKKYPQQIAKILIRNAPQGHDPQEIESAFTGLNKALWQIFTEPEELSQLSF
ncbi:MAG: App1 family protein [Gammaproteobacteria bacterium]|jgi:phosphatidate phosphatase APP1